MDALPQEDSDQDIGVNLNNGPLTAKAAVKYLTVVSNWLRDTFECLDISGTGVLDVNSDGPVVSRALAEAGLSHLWQKLLEMMSEENLLDEEGFSPIFFAWMGVDLAFEVQALTGVLPL